MKKIKINFTGISTRTPFDSHDNFILDMLKKHYEVDVCDNPDYIICGVLYPGASFFHGVYHEYLLDYPCVRIMIQGENFVPDYNLVDYSVCQYPLEFFDRNCYFPGGVEGLTNGHCRLLDLQHMNRDYSSSLLESKKYFASFVASHESEGNIRGDFFKALDARKRVESAGSYLNNMPDGFTVDWADGSKMEFIRKCKFTLCFESIADPGFITEKIVEAFAADTVPVYYGSSNVKEIFNPDAFVDVSDFASFEEAIGFILSLDYDDEKYMEKMRQPIFNDQQFAEKKMEELEQFLCHIFDQPLEKAYRRCRYYLPSWHEQFIKRAIENEIGWKELWSDKQIVKYLLRKRAVKILGKSGYDKLLGHGEHGN